jgi:hypothetical protein
MDSSFIVDWCDLFGSQAEYFRPFGEQSYRTILQDAKNNLATGRAGCVPNLLRRMGNAFIAVATRCSWDSR